MIGLNTLSPKPGARHRSKRIGCGRGSGHGETSTRGQKGQNARSGGSKPSGFEGGQTAILRRIPKSGFSNAMFARRTESVNISVIGGAFEKGAEVTPQALKEKRLVNSALCVKVLGGGELAHALKISAHAFSASAKEKIEKAGGSATLIAQPKPYAKKGK